MTTRRTRPTYTEKLHRHRLRVMLGKSNPCDCCPAARKFDPKDSPTFLWSAENAENTENYPCRVCREFVGIESSCPCNALGQYEALRRTLARLEED